MLKQDRKKHDVKVASIWFLVSLFLNLGWSIVFFAFQSPLAALVEILVLWGVLVYVAYLFEHIKKLSFYLLIPYLLWVLFAAFLNFRVVVLN